MADDKDAFEDEDPGKGEDTIGSPLANTFRSLLSLSAQDGGLQGIQGAFAHYSKSVKRVGDDPDGGGMSSDKPTGKGEDLGKEGLGGHDTTIISSLFLTSGGASSKISENIANAVDTYGSLGEIVEIKPNEPLGTGGKASDTSGVWATAAKANQFSVQRRPTADLDLLNFIVPTGGTASHASAHPGPLCEDFINKPTGAGAQIPLDLASLLQEYIVYVEEQRIGAREVELSVYGWRQAENCKPAQAADRIQRLRESFAKGVEFKCEGTAYFFGWRSKEKIAIYVRGKDIIPRVPEIFTQDVESFVKHPESQTRYLAEVYLDVVGLRAMFEQGPSEAGETYFKRLITGESWIGPILLYYADKIRELSRPEFDRFKTGLGDAGTSLDDGEQAAKALEGRVYILDPNLRYGPLMRLCGMMTNEGRGGPNLLAKYLDSDGHTD